MKGVSHFRALHQVEASSIEIGKTLRWVDFAGGVAKMLVSRAGSLPAKGRRFRRFYVGVLHVFFDENDFVLAPLAFEHEESIALSRFT